MVKMNVKLMKKKLYGAGNGISWFPIEISSKTSGFVPSKIYTIRVRTLIGSLQGKNVTSIVTEYEGFK